MNELVDNEALAISGDTNAPVWFSKIDLKYAGSQMQLSEETSRQCNFSIIGQSITGIYSFKTGFYGLEDLPNEFQRVMDSSLGHLPGVHFYLDHTVLTIRGSEERPWREFKTVLNVLNRINAAVEWSQCTFLVNEVEWLGFRLSNKGTVPVERKIESNVSMKKPENVTDIRSLIGSINQFIRINPNLTATTELFCNLLKKHYRFEWSSNHEKAFSETKKKTMGNFVQNHHFDVGKQTRIKCDAQKRIVAALEQLHTDG